MHGLPYVNRRVKTYSLMLPLKGKGMMTVDCKKLWRQVILRSLGAVVVGWAVVSAFVALLSLYGFSPDAVPVIAATQSPKFPENEQMLDDTAAQLARDGAALSKIEPAAGKSK
jgi:hypothetical protein